MRRITENTIRKFESYLTDEEKSAATLEKYIRDVTAFAAWCNGRDICKGLVMEYKRELTERYAPASVNSILSSLNSFFTYLEWYDCKVNFSRKWKSYLVIWITTAIIGIDKKLRER